MGMPQMRRKVAAWCADPGKCCDGRGLCRGERCLPLGFGGIGVEVFEGKLELRDQAGRAFGAGTVKRALHLGVLQFKEGIARQQIGVDRQDIGGLGLGFAGAYLDRRDVQLSGRKRLLQRWNIGGEQRFHRRKP